MNEKTIPDWDAIKTEYIGGRMSYASLAEEHGISASAITKRGQREGWRALRLKISEDVGIKAQKSIVNQRAAWLERFNEGDLEIAEAVKAEVEQFIKDARTKEGGITAQEIRALAGAAEAAQKIGRLALGATTDSHEHASKDGKPLVPSPTLTQFYALIGRSGER